MRLKQLAWLALAAVAATALTACNIGATPAPTVDVNAIYTSAAETLIADFSSQQTQTAQAMPPTAMPTNTPLATFTLLPTFPPAANTTPLGVGTLPAAGTPGVVNTPGAGTPLVLASPITTQAGPVCNNSAFMGENFPDGTVFKPGETFDKSWTLQNTGTCTWDEGYVFAFVAGDPMNGHDIALKKASDFVDPGESITFIMAGMNAHLAEGTYSGCWKMRDDQGNYFGTFACYEIVVKKK